jgi:peptide chain release factor subunit 1
LISTFFEEISQDTGKYVYGVKDTLQGLEMGAIETLICWENLDITRYAFKKAGSTELKIVHLKPDEEKDKSHFVDPEVSPYIPFEVDWLLW